MKRRSVLTKTLRRLKKCLGVFRAKPADFLSNIILLFIKKGKNHAFRRSKFVEDRFAMYLYTLFYKLTDKVS